ncbi:YvrJ family protein [Ammoniphilus resinae]|uniref:YvrJ family protein n=1 Tax=Ammoniphilus resinae TaxID=861532 RepID=UPI003158AFDD
MHRLCQSNKLHSKEGRLLEAFDRIPLISNLGFPIFVSWYLLTRVERKIDALATSITEMTQVIHG